MIRTSSWEETPPSIRKKRRDQRTWENWAIVIPIVDEIPRSLSQLSFPCRDDQVPSPSQSASLPPLPLSFVASFHILVGRCAIDSLDKIEDVLVGMLHVEIKGDGLQQGAFQVEHFLFELQDFLRHQSESRASQKGFARDSRESRDTAEREQRGASLS